MEVFLIARDGRLFKADEGGVIPDLLASRRSETDKEGRFANAVLGPQLRGRLRIRDFSAWQDGLEIFFF